jgi:PIN domain nuclease of toxin-antitoxin system
LKLLLYTHIWVWSALQPGRLSTRVARQLINPANEIWLSAVSVWELRLLHDKGRVKLVPDAVTWIQDNLTRLNIREAPLTFEVALAISSMNLPHNDPADGFIAATAKVFGLTLVTADDQLASLRDISVLSNR